MNEFSSWLRDARLSVHAGQEELAVEARTRDPASKVYQNRLSEWERGVCVPSLRQLHALLIGLEIRGVPPERLKLGRFLWRAVQLIDDDAGETGTHPPQEQT